MFATTYVRASKAALKNRLKTAYFNQNYSFLGKYSLFIPSCDSAISAVDELISLALLNRPTNRANCRIARLISFINKDDERGVAQLIASVTREAANFERA